MRNLLMLCTAVVMIACTGSSSAAQSPLLAPDPARLAAAAPDSFIVHFETSRGDFDVKVHRDWAPLGAGRLYYLASSGFYDSVRFFRVLDGFMAQFGAHGSPDVARAWNDRVMADDPVKKSNTRGTMSFATRGPNTRTTQLFINYGNNAALDANGFTAIGEVVKGMSVVDSLYSGYGEGAPGGGGPDQEKIAARGNVYLSREFPYLDYIKTARVSSEWRRP